MKKLFERLAAVGGGMCLVGLLIVVISLACGAQFGSLRIDSGVFRFIPFAQIKNEFISEVSEEVGEWYHHDTTLQNARLETGMVQKIKLRANGCEVQVKTGDENHTSAVLELSGKLTEDHIRQKWDDDGELELTIDSKQNVLPVDSSEYQAVLTVPPALIQLDIDASQAAVTVEDLTVTELDTEASMADVKLNKVVASKSDMKADMGNISGTVQLSGKNDMECSMGNIELTVTGVVDYGYTIENSMGNVNIGGHEHSGSHNEVKLNQQAATLFYVECSMGSVIVDFR